jgi:hypothetical protein
MKLLLFLFYVQLSSAIVNCNCKHKLSKGSLSQIENFGGGSSMGRLPNEDTCNFSRLCNLYEINIDSFINKILKQYKSISKVNLRNSEIYLDLLQNVDKPELNYFADVGFLNDKWMYCYYQDIYSAFFKYDEVKSIIINVEGNLQTILPCTGDYDPIYLPDNKMKKEWHRRVDYAQFINRDSLFKNNNSGTIILSFRDMEEVCTRIDHAIKN